MKIVVEIKRKPKRHSIHIAEMNRKGETVKEMQLNYTINNGKVTAL